MPYKPKRPCKYRGCKDFALEGFSYCRQHKLFYDKDKDRNRKNSYERGYIDIFIRFKIYSAFVFLRINDKKSCRVKDKSLWPNCL